MSKTKLALLVFAIAGMPLMVGCESVPMPDMSKFNLEGLLKEEPVVAIKARYSNVNIRSTPSTEKSPVATLKGGDKLTLLEENGSWLKVSFYDTTGNQQEGWIYKYLVEGYSKPVQVGTRSSVASDETPVDEVHETEPLVVEPSQGGQALPKSESVSPL